MKNIKSYEDFCNEEVNWKKVIGGAALGSALAFGSPSTSYSQINPTPTEVSTAMKSDGSFVIDVDSTLTRDEIYNKVLSWVSVNFKSTNVIKFQEKEGDAATIELRFIMESGIVSMGISNGHTNCDMAIKIKDGRYKIIIRNVDFEGNPGTIGWDRTYQEASELKGKPYVNFINGVNSEISSLIKSLNDFIESGSSSDSNEDDF